MTRFARVAFAVAAFWLIAGCGAQNVPGALTQRTSANSTSDEDLLYVSGGGAAPSTYLYSFPQGKLLEKIPHDNNWTLGECADTNGDVWIVYLGGYVTSYNWASEFTHEGKQIRVVNAGGTASQCSVDPTTGDLAVSGGGGLEIYATGSTSNGYGKWAHFPKSFFAGKYCTYDDKGNLFITGDEKEGAGKRGTGTYVHYLAELPHGHKRFRLVSLPAIKITNHGLVLRWDGEYLALGDGRNTIYRLAIKGRTARVVGKVNLRLAHVKEPLTYIGPFWVQGDRIVGALSRRSFRRVAIWNYPAGGYPLKVMNFKRYVLGVAVSVPPTR